MNNSSIVQHVKMFRKARDGWIDDAIENDSVDAARHILTINAKIELLLTMWSWSDESVEYP